MFEVLSIKIALSQVEDRGQEQVVLLRPQQGNFGFHEMSVIYLLLSVMSGFRRELDENLRSSGYYAASSGNLITDVSGQSVPTSIVKNPEKFLDP